MIKSPHDGTKIMDDEKIKHSEISPHSGIMIMGYWDFLAHQKLVFYHNL